MTLERYQLGVTWALCVGPSHPSSSIRRSITSSWKSWTSNNSMNPSPTWWQIQSHIGLLMVLKMVIWPVMPVFLKGWHGIVPAPCVWWMVQQVVVVKEHGNVIGRRMSGEIIPIWIKLEVFLAKWSMNLEPESLGVILSPFAGTTAIKASGGPAKKFCFGRIDDVNGKRSIPLGVEGVRECRGNKFCKSNFECPVAFRWPEQDENDHARCNLTQPDRLQASHSVGLISVYPEGPQLKASKKMLPWCTGVLPAWAP